MEATTPKPPKHLSRKMKAFWRSIAAEYCLEDQHINLLTLALEAYDRGQEAREILDKEGIVYLDRFNAPKSRPEIMIERDSRLSYARLMREIGIQTSQEDTERPPKLQDLLKGKKL